MLVTPPLLSLKGSRSSYIPFLLQNEYCQIRIFVPTLLDLSDAENKLKVCLLSYFHVGIELYIVKYYILYTISSLSISRQPLQAFLHSVTTGRLLHCMSLSFTFNSSFVCMREIHKFRTHSIVLHHEIKSTKRQMKDDMKLCCRPIHTHIVFSSSRSEKKSD